MNWSAPRFVALLTLLAILLGAGCSHRYKMTLTNGNVITTRGKPKLDAESGAFRYKDVHGKPGIIPSFRVREIEPL
ncbi:MAG TPA: YgdI/YgdR family lipoprotein [Methylomirabilota bacterium]|nr:YgdI/YgdR family lipoprotein [Methylomirabilota bacterium]